MQVKEENTHYAFKYSKTTEVWIQKVKGNILNRIEKGIHAYRQKKKYLATSDTRRERERERERKEKIYI